MSVVNILDVTVCDAFTPFVNPFKLIIKFECISELKEGSDRARWRDYTVEEHAQLTCIYAIDLEWKLIYVSSANSQEHDQVLDTLMVGPVPVGISQFAIEVSS